MNGWCGTLLAIDLSTRSSKRVSTQHYFPRYMGGRILAARLAWEHIPEKVSPFGPGNCIIITTGPLAGTLAPSSGRTVMSSVSPVSRPFPWYTHSTIGGWLAGELKAAGYDALIIKGQADGPVILSIHDSHVDFIDGEGFWGTDALETQSRLQAKYGTECQILSIGPAGENRVMWSTVQHNFDNAAGHSGFGAVWGSKRLKALIVRGTGGVSVANPGKLFKIWHRNGKFRINSEQKFLLYDKTLGGTAEKRVPGPICTQSCVNNCHQGRYTKTADGKTYDTFCIGPTFLSEYMPTAYRQTNAPFSLPEVPNGPDRDREKMVEAYNRLGLDLWMRVSLHTWLLFVKETGIRELGKRGGNDGFKITPQNPEWFAVFVEEVATRKGLGGYFSDGLDVAIEYFQAELPPEATTAAREILFGYGFQAHREGRFWDKTPLPFWLISAMMYTNETRDPTIGSHTIMHLSDILLERPEEAKEKFRLLGKHVWGSPSALFPDYNFEEKAHVALWCQRQHMLLDSLPLCDFAFPMLLKPFNSLQEWQETVDILGDLDFGPDLFNAVTGLAWTEADFFKAADRGLALERALLARSGRWRTMENRIISHFVLPCREDGTFIDEDAFEEMMDAFYTVKGWDKLTGWPTEKLLLYLDLPDVAEGMEKIRSYNA